MPRILVVEDDLDIRLLWEHVLNEAGYEIDTGDTVAKGCALIENRDYDVVVADGRLPDGVGIAIADKAREKDIPSLLVTGYAFILHELTADPERYEVLLKPVSPSEMVDAVARAMIAKVATRAAAPLTRPPRA